MKVYKTAQAERIFTKLEVEESQSHHHRRGFLVDEMTGRKLFPPLYFNKGKGEIHSKLVRKLRLALYLDEAEFDELMRCSMKKSQYFDLRRSRER